MAEQQFYPDFSDAFDDVGKGDGGESTRQAIALARQQAEGTLNPNIEALLPEGFGMINDEYIFEQKGDRRGTSSKDPSDIQAAQAEWNRINMSSPFGTSGYTIDEEGNIVLSSEFSPEMQALFGRGAAIAGGEGAADIETQAMNRTMRLLQPQIEQARNAFYANMQARGIPENSEIYKTGLANLRQAEDEAYQNAAFNAMLTSEQIQGQEFQQIAQLLSGAPTSPFTQVDVIGSFGPQLTQQGMFQQQQMHEEELQRQRESDLIAGGSRVGSAAVGAK